MKQGSNGNYSPIGSRLKLIVMVVVVVVVVGVVVVIIVVVKRFGHQGSYHVLVAPKRCYLKLLLHYEYPDL
jgi:flagellar biosynthesis/type III secretory pathway M-ring protein FliF/YscJ